MALICKDCFCFYLSKVKAKPLPERTAGFVTLFVYSALAAPGLAHIVDIIPTEEWNKSKYEYFKGNNMMPVRRAIRSI